MKIKSDYGNPDFWVGTIDRAIATLGQSAVVFLTAGVTGLLEVDFVQMASILGLAALASIATSLAYPKRVIAGEDSGQTAKVVEGILLEKFGEDITVKQGEPKHAVNEPVQEPKGKHRE